MRLLARSTNNVKCTNTARYNDMVFMNLYWIDMLVRSTYCTMRRKIDSKNSHVFFERNGPKMAPVKQKPERHWPDSVYTRLRIGAGGSPPGLTALRRASPKTLLLLALRLVSLDVRLEERTRPVHVLHKRRHRVLARHLAQTQPRLPEHTRHTRASTPTMLFFTIDISPRLID